MGLRSVRLQLSSGTGTPTVPHRNRTLFPTELRTRATAVWTRGAWHCRRLVSLTSTPEKLSGSEQRSRVSMRATAVEAGVFWNCSRSNRRQSHTQGLSWRPVQTQHVCEVTGFSQNNESNSIKSNSTQLRCLHDVWQCFLNSVVYCAAVLCDSMYETTHNKNIHVQDTKHINIPEIRTKLICLS